MKQPSQLGQKSKLVLSHLMLFEKGANRDMIEAAIQKTTGTYIDARKTLQNISSLGGYITNTSSNRHAWWMPTNKCMKLDLRIPSIDVIPSVEESKAPAIREETRKAVEKALQLAGRGGASQYTLAERSGLHVKTVASVVRQMLKVGKVIREGVGKESRVVLSSEVVKHESAKRDKDHIPVRNSTTTERNWVPPELKPFDCRPGAMDAFLLSSMVNGVRTPRKAPGIICSGSVGPLVLAAGGKRFSD